MANISHVDMYDITRTSEENVALAVLRLCDIVAAQNQQLAKIAATVDLLKNTISIAADKQK